MKYALGTIIGTALLGLVKAKRGGKNRYTPIKIEDIYKLSKTKKTQITRLDLSYNNYLTQLPDDIFDGFTKLKWLDLRGNQLTELSQSIGNLTNLKKLYLSENQLTELPDSIGNLTNLTSLELRKNELTELPEWIGDLTNLEDLHVWGNQLTELPEWIGNLTNLKSLYLSGNQLTELPKSFGNLTKLEELDLDDNKLTELPKSFGSLTKLRYLSLSNNPLQKRIPKEIIIKMIQNGADAESQTIIQTIQEIIKINNSIPVKSNLRLR